MDFPLQQIIVSVLIDTISFGVFFAQWPIITIIPKEKKIPKLSKLQLNPSVFDINICVLLAGTTLHLNFAEFKRWMFMSI